MSPVTPRTDQAMIVIASGTNLRADATLASDALAQLPAETKVQVDFVKTDGEPLRLSPPAGTQPDPNGIWVRRWAHVRAELYGRVYTGYIWAPLLALDPGHRG